MTYQAGLGTPCSSARGELHVAMVIVRVSEASQEITAAPTVA